MSTSSTYIPNAFQILDYRRKLKNYKKTTPKQCMKLLKKVRSMNLNNKMLIATQFPRTLIYVASRTKQSTQQDTINMNKMCRYLAKQWKKQLGVSCSSKKQQYQKQINNNKKLNQKEGDIIKQQKDQKNL